MLKDFLNFSRSEQNGIIVLIILIVITISVRLSLPYFYKPKSISIAEFDRRYDELLSELKAIEPQNEFQYLTDSIEIAPFNPNELNTEDWVKLGFTEKQSLSIIRYKESIGGFKKLEQIKNSYVISGKKFQQLEPYITLPAKTRIESKSIDKEEPVIKEVKMDTLFAFDPNTIDYKQLLYLGLDSYTAGNLVKYRESGGVFKTSDDLKKIYGLNDSLYNRIKPFIKLELVAEKPEIIHSFKPVKINSAGPEELQTIKGIGKTLSTRIVKYREMVGGFHSIWQLSEVYGIDSVLVQDIERKVIVDSVDLKKIRVNVSSVKKLNKHPYINFYLAKEIYDNRPYQEAGELRELKNMNSNLWSKLKPYLDVDEINE